MTPDTITSFLTYYLRSLSERTRKEKDGAQYGMDWIIYNLGLALGWRPVRLPWLPGGPDELSKTKPEAEFGIDLSFLRDGDETLVIFVLKDEVLSYGNWTAQDFDSDMRRAATPDITAAGLQKVKDVVVIVAYNKGDDARGITSFENTARALGTKVGDQATLRFERWNLTEITERIRNHLLTPSLVPQSFYGHFSYICAQVGDFVHGSDEWVNQLIPNWRRFIASLVAGSVDKRLLRLLPVVLVVVRGFGKPASAATGWLDLAEWAVLAAWNVAQKSTDPEVHSIVYEMWSGLYIEEVERFYTANSSLVTVEHGLETRRTGTSLDAVANAYVGFWHVGRLGLLVIALHEMMNRSPEDTRSVLQVRLTAAINSLITVLQHNPSTMRPVLDIQHIELFLTWRALRLTGQTMSIAGWLDDLQQRLLMRRHGRTSVPFVSGTNSWEVAFERAADKDGSRYFGDYSSYLLLMLLEFCSELTNPSREELLRQYFLRIVCAVDDTGERLGDARPIDLISWIPPVDWETRILAEPVLQGFSITVALEPRFDQPDVGICEQVKGLVAATRASHPFRLSTGIPWSALILGCLKHQSPLPPELWRMLIFREAAPT